MRKPKNILFRKIHFVFRLSEINIAKNTHNSKTTACDLIIKPQHIVIKPTHMIIEPMQIIKKTTAYNYEIASYYYVSPACNQKPTAYYYETTAYNH